MSVAIKKLDGVASVEVSLDKANADIRFNADNKITLPQLRQIIKKNGYPTRDAQIVAQRSRRRSERSANTRSAEWFVSEARGKASECAGHRRGGDWSVSSLREGGTVDCDDCQVVTANRSLTPGSRGSRCTRSEPQHPR